MTAIAIRKAKPTDQGFVATRWIHALREEPLRVDQVLDRKRVTVLIAHPLADEHRILGFICFEHHPSAVIVHAVYVRRAEDMRRGLADRLVGAAAIGRDVPLVSTSSVGQPWEHAWKATHMELSEFLDPTGANAPASRHVERAGHSGRG